MALSKVAVGCGTAVGVAFLLQKLLQEEKRKVADAEAAFPTAQLVAAMRAKDAQSELPQIGSNIGAGPDRAAEALAGDLGFEFMKELGGDHSSLVTRTMFFDDQWMKALDAGCKQFVILAAGLDARAWRLPRLDKSVKVFEVDVPRAMAYKAQKIEEIGLECDCTRVVVEADLSNPEWKQKLISAGFNPKEVSFFLIEGLLMYLPPEAPQALFHTVSTLMQPSSTIVGDTFVNCLRIMNAASIQKVLAKYGTKWTFDFDSDEALIAQLAEASLKDADVQNLANIMNRAQTEGGEEDEVRTDANSMAQRLSSIRSWPPQAIDWVRQQLQKDDGAESVIRELVDDRMGFNGLKDKSAEHKAAVYDMLLVDGCAEKLRAAIDSLPAVVPKSMLDRVSDTFQKAYMMYQYAMLKMKLDHKSSSYSVYVARKA